MEIIYTKRFSKQYEKLSPKLKLKVDETIDVFGNNPLDPELRNHALKGYLAGQRSIDVTGDVRIIFEQHQQYTLVIMLKVGTHSQLYR